MISKKTRNRTLLIGSIILIAIGLILIWAASISMPELTSVNSRRVEQSTKIYDRTGEVLLYDVSKDSRRTSISLNEISEYAKKATIAIEDKDFYSHRGFRLSSFIRAVLANTTSFGFSQGGSTITQQVVKNVLLSRDKTITRKIKEIVLSLKLEQVLTKDEILTMYFNEIPYGGSIFGIEEASESFFGKSAKDLNLVESAYLAAIPQAPTFYSPYGQNTGALENRKKLVLEEMKKSGFITENELDSVVSEKISFIPKQTSSIKAPHFVFYVTDYLKKKYGRDVIETGGLRVITTLDYDLQTKGEDVAKRFASENEKNFGASNDGFVALDPKTGQILVMVGSRDYFDEKIDGNFNIITAHRQPGSTFKPFVYAEAFKKGYTPETVLFDVKTQFAPACKPDDETSEENCYSPNNYDEKFRGPITMRSSLAQSINITSVKTLYLAGLNDSLTLARNMGMSSLGDADRYGLTLVLGGGEVSPLEITSAYGTFASGGVRNLPTPILKITDAEGNLLESFRSKPQRVLPENIALLVSDILSDNNARAPSFGQTSALYFPNSFVAVKTGTTNDYRDAWIIGYTKNIVLGAWAGNNDNSPMEKKVAGFIVAPMWREFMNYILTKTKSESFGYVSKDYPYSLKPVLRGEWRGGISDIGSGDQKDLIATSSVREKLSGGIHNILFWVEKNSPRGDVPKNPESDSQFVNWEFGVQKWLKENGLSN